MRYTQYKFKFYVNANHAIYLNGVLGANHPHTWEVILDTVKVRDDFVLFDTIEDKIETFFARFQDVDINKIDPFTTLNPTLENLTIYFKDELKKLLLENGWLLSAIEVAETPARSFIIDLSDEAEEYETTHTTTDRETVEEIAEEKLKKLIES